VAPAAPEVLRAFGIPESEPAVASAPAEGEDAWPELVEGRPWMTAPPVRAGAKATCCGGDPRRRRTATETGNEDAVSIRAIADAVGVTPPSIYLHFLDKEAWCSSCNR
jgi:hypothetical protein